MDLATPRNLHLSAFFKRSNAIHNAAEKMPNSLMLIIESLKEQTEHILEKYGQEVLDEFQGALEKICLLREEVLEDTPFRKLHSTGRDVEFYNNYLMKMTSEDCIPRFLQTGRLYSECYMYRRVCEAFETTTHLCEFDPYEKLKRNQFVNAIPLMVKTGKYLTNILQDSYENDSEDFGKLIKLSLWSNRLDLTMLKDISNLELLSLLDTSKFESNIACDQIEEAWEVISNRESESNIIDIVTDNAGYEVFMDLCVADFLLSRFYARKIRFFVKNIPWFITDVTKKDIIWTINQMKKFPKMYMLNIAAQWESYLKDGRFEIIVRKFWTLPVEFTEMPTLDPNLYTQLKQSKLLIVKGDLNYRKLFGDKNWGHEIPLHRALQGFNPTNILCLRVMKSDLVCGLAAEVADIIEKSHPDWLVSGEYAIIQYSAKYGDECECVDLWA